MFRPLRMYTRVVADALSLPVAAVVLSSAIGFVLLVCVGVTGNVVLGVLTVLWGLGIASAGVRAMVLPGRVVSPSPGALWIINTSRQAGAVWVLAGLVYMFVAITATLSQ